MGMLFNNKRTFNSELLSFVNVPGSIFIVKLPSFYLDNVIKLPYIFIIVLYKALLQQQ